MSGKDLVIELNCFKSGGSGSLHYRNYSKIQFTSDEFFNKVLNSNLFHDKNINKYLLTHEHLYLDVYCEVRGPMP